MALTGRVRSVKLDRSTTPVLFFLAVNILLVPVATYPQWAMLEIIRIFACVISFFLIVDAMRRPGGDHALALGITVIVLLQVAAALIQSSSGVTVSGLDLHTTKLNAVSNSSYRLVGTIGHPGTLAQFLTALFPLLAYCVVSLRRGIALKLALIAIPVLIIFTQSRTGIVVLALLFVIMTSAYLVSVKSVGKRALLLTVATGVVVVVAGLLWSTITTRFLQAPEESTIVRGLLVDIAWSMVRQHPFLGVGLNNFTEVMRNYDVSGISSVFDFPVHNIYLLILAETGALGFVAFLTMNVYFVAAAVRNIRRCPDGLFRSLSFFCLLSLMSTYLTGMLGWGWRQDGIQMVYWVCLACIAAETRLPFVSKRRPAT